MESHLVLTPAQKCAYDGLIAGIGTGAVCVLRGDAGMGKTTILHKVNATTGGGFLSIKQFLESLSAREPAAIEEAFLSLVGRQLKKHDLVFIDDVSLLTDVTNSRAYPRANLLEAALTALLNDAAEAGKKLVFGIEYQTPEPIRCRAYCWKIGDFTPQD